MDPAPETLDKQNAKAREAMPAAPPGFNEARQAGEVVRLLTEHGIHCCLVGVKALRYYGAPRVSSVRPRPAVAHRQLNHPDPCQTLEFCVPTDQLAAADALFSSGPASTSYTAWRGLHPVAEGRLPASLYHTFPRYHLSNDLGFILFDFYLVPSADWCFDCTPANFEYSAQHHLPYPKLPLFAQSLMERQSLNDFQDLVDGMDLTEAWGEENLRFSDHGEEYAQWVTDKNNKIRAALPRDVKEDPLTLRFGPGIYLLPTRVPNFRERFLEAVRTKEGRIEGRIGIKAPPGLYATQYRLKGSPDPRTRVRRNI